MGFLKFLTELFTDQTVKEHCADFMKHKTCCVIKPFLEKCFDRQRNRRN